jgi:aquaporin Z
MVRSVRTHWPEYLSEATGLGLFMVAAGLCATLLEHPASPAREALPSAFLRRGLMGGAMGLALIGLIYSPWGRRSGAHLNPALTLAFWRLGKVAWRDAVGYMTAQFLGGVAGTTVVVLLLGDLFRTPPIQALATLPGDLGTGAAFAAEAAMTFTLMLMILLVSHAPRLARFTGLAVGLLIAGFITFEAPLSGTSLNPARTVASALPSGTWTDVWVYFAAPTLGGLAAAQAYLWLRCDPVHCAKLLHCSGGHCVFCNCPPDKPPAVPG